MKIFLADDDEDDRIFFANAIENISLVSDLKSFSNGVDLMNILYSSENLPNIIFLDLNMPMMDGFECLSDIRLVDTCKNIPVVIYSGAYNEKQLIKLQRIGATHYIQKPNSFSELKKLLAVCIEKCYNLSELAKKDLPSQFVIQSEEI